MIGTFLITLAALLGLGMQARVGLSCDEKMCSHGCATNKFGIHNCKCPSGMNLGNDGRTCIELKCPRNFYLSLRRTHCIRCPRNSYTVSGGMESITNCICLPGFKGYPIRTVQCTDINECDINNHGCSDNCVNTPGSAYCSCPGGFHLDPDNKTCIDTNECLAKTANRCQHLCHNTLGGYLCSCLPGYVALGKYKCESCRGNSYNPGNESLCTECPANSMTDGPGKTSIADCSCLPGFVGNPSKGLTCSDIDECKNSNFNCSHECYNVPGSAHCSCPQGYQLDTDGKTCIDINECSIQNGGCEGTCKNLEGSFNCSCAEGYKRADFYSCADVDECAESNGGCGHRCVNFPGGYYCSCDNGHKLESDQKSCTAKSCPRIPQHPNSNMNCIEYDKDTSNTVIPKENADFPVGTACSFQCHKGYQANNNKTTLSITCQEDGRWSDNPLICIALLCPALEEPAHGKLHPRACKDGRTKVLQKCYFTCDNGYRLNGSALFRCGRRGEWLPKHISTICEPIKVTTYVSCYEDITVVLPPHRNYTSVKLPTPRSEFGLKDIKVFPDWVKLDSVSPFPFGVTDVVFEVRSPTHANVTSSCTVTVTVQDEEIPVVHNCPNSFNTNAESIMGTLVTWNEPSFTDNVGLISVTKNIEPNSILSLGIHIVKYFAVDASGNMAKCEFSITVTGPKCGFLDDPANGHTSCDEWVFGRMCMPICNPGYVLYPSDPSFFVCDEYGMWQPTNKIQDCMKMLLPSHGECERGYELQILPDTGEEICVECPPYFPWSEKEQKCSKELFSEDYERVTVSGMLNETASS